MRPLQDGTKQQLMIYIKRNQVLPPAAGNCSAFLPSVCPQSTEHVKDPTSIHIMLLPVKNASSNTF